MLRTTTAAALLGATALLIAGCSGDSGTDTATTATDASPTAAQSQPATIPAQDWATQVDALCAVEVSAASDIPEPDTGDTAALSEYIGQLRTLVAQLATDISAVGVPNRNAEEAAELAGYFEQTAAILDDAAADADIDAMVTEVDKITPAMDALAKKLDVPSCAS